MAFAAWFCERVDALPHGDELDSAYRGFNRGKTVKLKVTPMDHGKRQVECWVEL